MLVARIALIALLLGVTGCTLVANPDPYYPYPVQRYIWLAPAYGYYGGGYYGWRSYGNRPCPPKGRYYHQGNPRGYGARAGRRHRRQRSENVRVPLYLAKVFANTT